MLTLMKTCPLPGSTLVICGASGAVGAGVTDTLLEATLSPAVFTAISDIRYSVPLVSPVIVMGLVSPVAGNVTALVSVIVDTLFELPLAV